MCISAITPLGDGRLMASDGSRRHQSVPNKKGDGGSNRHHLFCDGGTDGEMARQNHPTLTLGSPLKKKDDGSAHTN
jgi:hypothetical protein